MSHGPACGAWLLCAGILLAAAAQTRVSGVIDHNVRWTPKGSPYIIEGDILVTRKARLVIAPGTRVEVTAPRSAETKISQLDRQDSSFVAIKIEGMLSCAGKPDARVVISPPRQGAGAPAWYGVVFDSSYDELAEISFTDIAGAVYGITARACSPLVRNSVLEYNIQGVRCLDKGNVRLSNCVIARNATCGIRVEASNPVIYNSIIVDNRNNGVWCDGISKMDFRFNCLFGNGDGNWLDCEPELGILRRVNKNKDSVDIAENLYQDPIFSGSPGDSAAVERDIRLPTDKSRVADTSLAKALHDTLTDLQASSRRTRAYPRYELSRYSPCINAGHTDKRYKDIDGSRNDLGIWGGPEFLSGESGGK